MAGVVPLDRRVIRFALAERTFSLHLEEGPTERRLRRIFVEPTTSDADDLELHLDVQAVFPATFSQVILAVLRRAAAALFPEVLCFHAAALGGAGGATMFVGPTGVGKTTIAVLGARLALDVLADDVACVRVRDRMMLPSIVRLSHRDAMTALVAPPTRRPHVAKPTPLGRVVLLGAGAKSTAAFVGKEALLSDVGDDRRWEAATMIASVLEGRALERVPRLRLHHEAGLRAARLRLPSLLAPLGVHHHQIDRVLSP